MSSYIPDVTTVLEHTGTINNNSADVEEGEITEISESNGNTDADEITEVAKSNGNTDADNANFHHHDCFDQAAATPNEDETHSDAFMDHLNEGSLIVDSSNNDHNAGPR
jgi:hypothetical protein